MIRVFRILLIVLSLIGERVVSADEPPAPVPPSWLAAKELPPLPDALGVAGPFVGIHEDVLLVAGGANFPEPIPLSDKVWRSNVFSLRLTDAEPQWKKGTPLPEAIGYGASVSLPEGILCIGGNRGDEVFSDVFLLRREGEDWVREELPSLPHPLCYADAAFLNGAVYVVSGQTGSGLETATRDVWKLAWDRPDGSGRGEAEGWGWEKGVPLPGDPRAFAGLATQSDGRRECLYLVGGRTLRADGEVEFLDEVWKFDPLANGGSWQPMSPLPEPRAAGTAVSLGQGHLLAIGGDDGEWFGKSEALGDRHPGFPRAAYAYHTITDTWTPIGDLPLNQVTTKAVPWEGGFLVASGEVRPRVRTDRVYHYTLRPDSAAFSPANWIAILLYLGGIVGIGVFFARRNRTTEDFFRGGQRVPGWVAGLSIFATLLSSITFIALPARAFATDWVMIVVNAGILICAPLVVYAVIPRFRRINATSAYEYLEQRFHLAIRLFASVSFILFQIGRMAIVMYLPALALATITPLGITQCILVMGVLSILYCSLGGLEAVVWTDALQAIVLIGGALLSFLLILGSLDGGWSEFVAVANEADKFQWADFDFGSTSYLTTAFWVVLLGGIGSSLIPYTSDQAVVQRYVSTATPEKAQSAVWLNAAMSAIATILFFGLGTALYVFYKSNPGHLDAGFKTDSILPLFIARELPVGIAGIVIAAIFAAAQSTISSSMNSTATVVVTDFFRRFEKGRSETSYLRLARFFTVLLGCLGTGFALFLAWSNIESAWQTFLMIIGFLMGPLCGLFLLGMFTGRSTTTGAVAGAAAGVISLFVSRFGTEMHGLLYAPIGIGVTFAVGWAVSRIFHRGEVSPPGPPES